MHNYTNHDLLVITNLLDNSISDLIKYDRHLIETKSGELTLNHRLAFYIEKNLTDDYKDYNVDCEYFRDCTDPDLRKRIPSKKGKNDKKPIPDIIIHKRGNNYPTNYLYVEAKRLEENTDDLDKIKFFITDVKYKYQFAAYVKYLLNEKYITYDLYYFNFETKIERRIYLLKNN
jgi:hypothetical protein